VSGPVYNTLTSKGNNKNWGVDLSQHVTTDTGDEIKSRSILTTSEQSFLEDEVTRPTPRPRPKPFKHLHILGELEKARPIKQEDLINKINYLNFIEREVYIHLRDQRQGSDLLITARPEPIVSQRPIFNITGLYPMEADLYTPLHVILPTDSSMIIVDITPGSITPDHISFELPDKGYEVNTREIKRHACKDIEVDIRQNAFYSHGKLVDYSPKGMKIWIEEKNSSPFTWFNEEAEFAVTVRRGNKAILSINTTCIRHSRAGQAMEMVLKPVKASITQFRGRKIRNPRHKMVPPLEARFTHPLCGTGVAREVFDITSSGFSVLENKAHAVLVPGLIIPEVTLDYAGVLKLRCMAQVIYTKEHDEENNRCGVAILDMDLNSYTHLANILESSIEPNARVSSDIDLDALWEFFFETGFVYPKKYGYVKRYKKDLVDIYTNLYTRHPEIARNFVYKKDGRIYGHVSLIRAYEKAWMFHHLAARPLNNTMGGFVVMKQINHFCNELCRMPSANLDYFICYFRPENRFPYLLFGGYAKKLKNPGMCSLDEFTYMMVSSKGLGKADLPDDWRLRDFSNADLEELELSYKKNSGGLLLNVLGVGRDVKGKEDLERLYERLGFLRRWQMYSLLQDEDLRAVFVVNQSNILLNLSELLNCIKIIITDEKDLPWDVLKAVIWKLSSMYPMDKVPLMIFPSTYVEEKNLKFDRKKYMLWIYDSRYVSEFMEFMQSRFKIKHW